MSMLKFFRVPFALSGTRTAIPDAADPSGFVSYIEGYGADYQRAKADPLSKNIERDKMNELFFDTTNAIAELQSQGIPDFITTTLNGGSPYSYAANALVRWSDGKLYRSLVAANTTLPTDATKWAKLPIRNIVDLEFFGAVGDGVTDDSAAAHAACLYCWATGATLRLNAKAYYKARIEVHGSFSVEGCGATVDYLGVGTTYIAGTGTGTSAVPTAWPNDPSYDPEGNFNPVMFNLTAAAAVGSNTLTLNSVTGLAVGQVLFLGGNPTSASSVTNYIPANFEFVQIQSIAGLVVTLNGRLKNSYTTAAAAFYSAGLAYCSTIRDLKIRAAGSEAYQAVVRSALNVQIANVVFAGRDTLGGATFSQGLRLENLAASGAGGNWSFARGTVSAVLDQLEFQYRGGLATEPNVIFVEESCYTIAIRGVRGNGASFSVRQMDMTGAGGRRTISVFDSIFDVTNSPNAPGSPLQMGTAAGVDIDFVCCEFSGSVTTPNSSTYPGITGDALTWVTGNQTTDRIKFVACRFNSGNAGAVFTPGSGVQGSVLFDDLCTYDNCSPALTQYTPRGAWVNMGPNLLSGFTIPASNVAQYRVQGKDIYFRGRLNLNGAAAGSSFFKMPAGQRPLSEARDIASTDGAGVFATIRTNTSGDVFYVGSNGAPTYLQLDGYSITIDA